MEMKRVIVFLPPAAIRACDGLARRYASNRSEVIRLAVSEGMAGVRVALARLQKLRLTERQAAEQRRALRRRGSPPASGVAGPTGVVPLDADRAVSVLTDYARSARRVHSRLDDDGLRVVLVTHAQVVGVDVDDIDSVVEQALAAVGQPVLVPGVDPTVPPE